MGKETNVKNIQKMFGKNRDSIPHEIYRELADANTEGVINTLRREISRGTITERFDPTSAIFNGKFSTTLGKMFDPEFADLGLKAVVKNVGKVHLLRMMGDLPPVNLNVKNLDEAYDQLNEFMDGVGIAVDKQDDLLRRICRYNCRSKR